MDIQSVHISQSPIFQAFRHAPVGMGIFRPDGTALHVNAALCDIAGYAEDEWNGLRFQDIVHPSCRHVYLQAVSAADTCASSPAPVFVRIVGKDGTPAEVQLTVHSERDAGAEAPYVLVYTGVPGYPQTAERMGEMSKEWDPSLFLHNPAMILAVDLNGNILAANDAAQNVLGYRSEELIGVNCSKFLDEGQEHLFDLYNGITLNQPMAYEARIRRKDGNIVELGVKNVPIITNGQVTALYVIGRDITEFKRNQVLKNKAEQELRETVRNQLGMTFKFKRIDGQYIHTLCDGELLYRLGLTPDQVIGKTLHDFFPPEICLSKLKYYDRAWAGEDVVYEGRRGDVWYLASLRPIKKGGVVEEVIASCVDITERKKAERELVEAKEQFESLFNSSPLAIGLLDTDGDVIRVNPAHEALYGWSNSELKGKPLPLFPDHRQEEWPLLKSKVMAGYPVVDFETERVRKDGTLLTVSLTVAPLRDKEGRLFGFTGLARDITDRKKTEELLRQADKLNVVGQLAAGLAHEIRNPLTSLRGFLQLLRAGNREKEQFYDLMLSELDRINTILGELLIIAKPQITQFQQKDLMQMLKDVLNLLMPQAILQNIQFLIDFDTEPLLVHCSETELKQVFINIIKNGMEAMPQGGVLSIRPMLSGDNEVTVRICDQGVGIRESLISKLGEPFYTTKEMGTGLGLMMCHKIIEAHRGSIVFSSKVNVGTTVDVALPLLQASVE
ncbi:PAS domain S-box protein [Gordoniibacillus kamchatkensis]|uniref:PAS domain S-box protein n=1 Tax=Gordoniibacillus kamchatkensis TaxID=1590651 RepID=UPI000697034B|nr:PAS domain S-box protein [Paenibacillus sp. VKM B-2647]